jgi:hypothetical protein
MLRTHSVNRRQVQAILPLIGRLLLRSQLGANSGFTNAKGSIRFAIAESFEIWVLDEEAISDSSDGVDVRALARQSARCHHQVSVGHRPVAFAQTSHENNRTRLRAFGVSALAKNIDRATDGLHRRVRQNATVRLLEIPSGHALWIVPDDARRNTRVLLLTKLHRLRVKRHDVIASSVFTSALQRAFAGQLSKPFLEA